MLVPRKVVRRLKKSPPKFFFVACPVTCENYNWSSSTKRVCVCVKKKLVAHHLLLDLHQTVSVCTFPPTIIQRQKTTQNTRFFRNRTYTSYSEIKDTMFFGPFTPKETKNSTLKHPFFCCKCLPTDGLWPRWSRLSSQTPALVHVNWLKSITGWLELNHVSLWKDLLKICAICGKLAGTITHWICSGVSPTLFLHATNYAQHCSRWEWSTPNKTRRTCVKANTYPLIGWKV